MEKHHRRFLFSIALVLGAASGGAGAADDATLGGDFPRIIASAKQAPVVVSDDGVAKVSVNYLDKLHFKALSTDRFADKCFLDIDIPNSSAPYISLIVDFNCDGAVDSVSMSSSDELRHFSEISEDEYLFLQRMGAAAADSFEAIAFLDRVSTVDAAARMRENPYLMSERLRNAVSAATESTLMLEDPAEQTREFVVAINFVETNVGQMLKFVVDRSQRPRPDCLIFRVRDDMVISAFNEGCNTEWDFFLEDDGTVVHDKELARSFAMSALDSLLRFAWVANNHFALDLAQ